MKTLQRQISLFTEEQLTYSQEGFLANHIQAQESDLGKRTSDTSGRICSESFQKLSQPTLWGKTFVDLLIGMGEWSSKKCALTWKVKGTKYNRYYCQLVPSVRHTEEIVSGLLPTPTVIQGGAQIVIGKQKNNTYSAGLHDLAKSKLLPTPTVFDSTNASATMKSSQVKEGSMHSMTLTRMMDKGMLPTPTVSDMNAGRRGNQPRANHNPLTNSLKDSVNYVEQTSKCSHLNPRFVAEMMGFPPNWTELPFLNGEVNL
jgi:hypothetical protein